MAVAARHPRAQLRSRAGGAPELPAEAARPGGGECRSPLTRLCCARRPAAMEEGMSSMQQKAAELEHMAEVLLTGEQLR